MAAGLPWLGAWTTDGGFDVGWMGLSGLALVGGAWLQLRRRALVALPLELGRVAVRASIDGRTVVRVRARLGRGRRLRDPSVSARFVTSDGQEHVLPTLWPVNEVTGAFTVSVLDREGITAGAGALTMRVEVRAADRTWHAERSWDALRDGRFAAPVVREGGRWAHDRARWDHVAE